MKPLWVFSIALLVSAVCEGEDSLEIKTESGTLRGTKIDTRAGKEVVGFLGVPFAAPPEGRNRFAPPKPLDPWNGVLVADKFSKDCFQFVDEKIGKMLWWVTDKEQSENCLSLNVWVPTPRPKNSAVLVWIHGGGFFAGSTSIPLYDGSVLASEENIIVVSINYRLSALGFLYLDHPDAPGNVGLMDQAAGLNWIQKNIAKFGGDPKRVTIFGESAGGAAVGFQLLLPTSLDLFRNAILESGTPTAPWAFDVAEDALKNALLLAEKLGCPVQADREKTVRCLQAVDEKDLLKTTVQLHDKFLSMLYRPVIDGKYLRSSPIDLTKEGTFCGSKNVIVGFTKEDGSFMLPMCHHTPPIKLEEDVVLTHEHRRRVIKDCTASKFPSSSLQEDLLDFVYTDWEATSKDKFSVRKQIIHFFTDYYFECPSVTMTEKIAEKGNKVFAYRYDHIPTSRPHHPIKISIPKWLGSNHGDELPFLFGASMDNPKEQSLSKKMMRYWANFARNDDPSDSSVGEWPAYTSEERLRLNINADSNTVEEVGRKRECSFWERIFPKLQMNENNVV